MTEPYDPAAILADPMKRGSNTDCARCHGTGAVWADPPACTCGAGPACGIPGVGHEPYCGAEQCPNGCAFRPFRSYLLGGGA